MFRGDMKEKAKVQDGNEIVFIPRRTGSFTLLFWTVWLAGLASIFIGLYRPFPTPLRFAGLCGVVGAIVFGLKTVSRIVFGTNIVVIRYVFRDSYFNYKQIESLFPDGMQTVRGRVRLCCCANNEEFKDVCTRLAKRGSLAKSALKGIDH